MKKNIFADRNKNLKSIFKDETIFYSEFIPEKVNCRDIQVKELTYLLEPINNKKKASNILLYGPPGTGKTMMSKFVLNELINYTKKAKYIIINAIQDNSRMAIYSKIATLFKLPLPRRGLAVDEIIDRIKEELSKCDFIPIIVIDEIDQLDSKQCSNLLYDLTRINIDDKYFCLLLITNHRDFVLKLDPRTKSSLFLNSIEFNKYSPKDLKDILNQRISFGLIPNSISSDLVGFIAGYSSRRGGDARIAIDLLYKSAKESDKCGNLELTKDVILSSSKSIDYIKINEKINYLGKGELKLLHILEDGMLSTDIYSKSEIPVRTVRRYLSNLEKVNLIRFENINSNTGRTRKLFLNFDKSII